jgi:hypothetical protein
MITEANHPSNEELAELEAELDEMRKASWKAWLATGPVIDLDDEF